MTTSTNWSDFRDSLNLSTQEEAEITIEKELIQTLIDVRQSKNLSQKDLAELCHVKQPFIAKMEKGVHSPQINSLLKLLIPLGYTLKILPLESGTDKTSR